MFLQACQLIANGFATLASSVKLNWDAIRTGVFAAKLF
jgi:hypothetical protein